jgi:phospholipase/carboxylesterase
MGLKELNKKFFIGAFIFVFCSNTNLLLGQNTGFSSPKSNLLYFEGPAIFECNIQFPDNYNKAKALPLVIALHGGGGSGETFKNIWKHFKNPQFILATPQAPYKWLMGDKIGYDWSAWPTGDIAAMAKALDLTPEYIKSLIHLLTEKYRVSEVYLLGFSQGSIVVQIAGIKNQDLISGMIILSGPPLYEPGWSPWSNSFEIDWPEEEIVRSANNLEVFLAHGKSDTIIAIEGAYRSRDLYKKFTYDVALFEFEGGHEINIEAIKELQKWLEK